MMRSYSALLLAVALFATAGNLHAQDKTFALQGTIGTYPIAMNLSCSDGECYDSRYFYLSTGQDIYMNGAVQGKHYKFTAGNEETFELDETGDGTFSGTWRDKKGKSLPVSLKKINIAAIQSPYDNLGLVDSMKHNDPLSYLRTSLLKFVRDSVSDRKGKQIIWFHEAKSGAPFFRLGNGFAKEIRERINPKLDALHISNALERLSCTSSFGEGMIDFTIEVTYLDPDLLGFNVFSYYDCGGAHPDFGGEGYLLDLHTGKYYSIDEILAFDKSVTTEEQSGFDAFSNYRNTFFAPKLMALENQQHHFKKPVSEDDCDYLNEEVWDYPAWKFTEHGIVFSPSFPHVMAPCREDFILPFSRLAIYKHPRFPYAFPK